MSYDGRLLGSPVSSSAPDPSGAREASARDLPEADTEFKIMSPALLRANSHDGPIDIAYLYSWPLVSEAHGAIERLDFEAERELMRRALQKSRRRIHFRREVATSSNLRELLTLSFAVLHYTGHGINNMLAFEDGMGTMHGINDQNLKELFEAGGGAEGVKFVFVSACASELTGNAFVRAGVQHVIAVRTDAEIADQNSMTFTRQFYIALLRGKTIKQSFDIALKSVDVAPNNRQLNESKKFLLLPKGGNHDVSIFSHVREGQWVNLSEASIPSNVPAMAEHFRFRNFELREIVAAFSPAQIAAKRRRLVSVTGEQGIGKTALAVAAARYMQERRFFKAINYVELDEYVPCVHPDALAPDAFVGGERPCVSLPALLAEKLRLNSSPDSKLTDMADVVEAIRNIDELGHSLLVLDGIDEFLDDDLGPDLSARSLIRTLLAGAPYMRVLVTCRSRNGVGGIELVGEQRVHVEELPTEDAARLFHRLAPRRIEYHEFGCTQPHLAVSALARHRIFHLVKGHPRRIFRSAQLLDTHVKLDDLPPLVERMLHEEECELQAADQRRERRRQRRRNPHAANRHDQGGGPAAAVPAAASAAAAAAAAGPASSDEDIAAAIQRSIPEESGRGVWRAAGGTLTAPWEALRREISHHFLSVTRQNSRPLADEDLDAMQRRLQVLGQTRNAQIVRVQAFGKFWCFFSKFVGIIENNVHLWQRRDPLALYGLMTRNQAHTQLRRAPKGHFIIRFSENSAGCVAVAYVDAQRKTQHVLVRVREDNTCSIATNSDNELIYPSVSDLIIKCKPLEKLHPGIFKADVFGQGDADVPN